MGFVTGLAGVREQQAKQPARQDFADREPAKWVSLKPDESVKLTPLQEVDDGSPLYSKKNGLAIWSLQHSNPDDWKKNAECTADEGDCYGCAQGWRQKTVFYINVLVDDGKNEPYVAILSRGLGKNSVAQEFINIASDEEFDNSITGTTFKYTRNGDKKDTTYSLTALPKKPTYDLESYTLFNLQDYVFHVNPDKQEAYYLDLAKGESAPAREAAPATSTSVNQDW